MVEATDAEFARLIIFQALGEDPAELPIYVGEGSVNVVFAAEISVGIVAVRFAKECGDLIEFENERRNIQRAEAMGIPVAKVLAIGLMSSFPYIIQSYVPGVTGEKSAVSSAKLWTRLGEYSRIIHAVNTPENAFDLTEYEMELYNEGAPTEWRKFVKYNIESLGESDQLRRLGVYDLGDQRALTAIFEELLETPFQFGLNHNDLDPRHLIVGEQGQLTLIDWGESIAHIVPHVDLAEILRWHSPEDICVQAFLLGYGMSSVTFETILPQVRSYQLLKSFDLVRWSIDQRPHQIGSYTERAAREVSRALHGTDITIVNDPSRDHTYTKH